MEWIFPQKLTFKRLKPKMDLASELDSGKPPWLDDVLWKFFEERTLIINDVIDDNLIEDVILPIHLYNAVDNAEPDKERKPIRIFINTDGGDLDPCFALIDAMLNSVTPIHTYTVGRAYSAGFLLAIAGHKRFANKYSTFLLHEGELELGGNTSKVLEVAHFYKKTRIKQISEFVCSRTNITSAKFDKYFKEEQYFIADDALKLGIIDEIVSKEKF